MIDRKPEFILGLVGSIINFLIGLVIVVGLIVAPTVINNLDDSFFQTSGPSNMTYESDFGEEFDLYENGQMTIDNKEDLMKVYDVAKIFLIMAVVFLFIIAIVGFIASATVKKKTEEKATAEGIIFIVLGILTSLNVFFLVAGILALSRNPKIEEIQS